MKKSHTQLSLIILTILLTSTIGLAGGIPLTNDDPNLSAAINSNNQLLDILSNDGSGIQNDNYKEVIAVCDSNSSDMDCSATSYTDGISTISLNGAGENNNVLLNSDNNSSHVFSFKYIMKNSVNATGSAVATVTQNFVEVNTLSDSGNGVCNATACTLRDAMTFAVNDNEASIINFDRNLQGTITLNSGLTVSSIDLTITGPGADKITVSGNDLHRVLLIPASSERFSLSGLTLANGLAGSGNHGAGILIENALQTTIDSVRVINNSSNNDGGGIHINNASLTLSNSEISNNAAMRYGGGISIIGGFGYDVTISNTTISSNQSSDLGSGLYVNTSSGHNLNLLFITAAFNPAVTADNRIQGTGNVFIESSLFEPGLSIPNSNNISNNSLFSALSNGNVFGDNNQVQIGAIVNSSLTEINNTGMYGHKFDTNSLAYNHVDTQFGNSGCGTQITVDQFGTPRPTDGFCDAGAYEYVFIDVIFVTGFE